MPDVLKIVYEDAKGGPYVRLYVNEKWVAGAPVNSSDPIDVGAVGGAAAQVAKALGAQVVVENETAYYDARGNRVTL
jgi:hypothetical protein